MGCEQWLYRLQGVTQAHDYRENTDSSNIGGNPYVVVKIFLAKFSTLQDCYEVQPNLKMPISFHGQAGASCITSYEMEHDKVFWYSRGWGNGNREHEWEKLMRKQKKWDTSGCVLCLWSRLVPVYCKTGVVIKGVTCGRACSTVSRSSRTPLAIFSNFRTAEGVKSEKPQHIKTHGKQTGVT